MSESTSQKILALLDEHKVSEKRKQLLNPIVDYILNKIRESKESHLIFICTHNSRRSQMAQFWAQYLADYFELPISAYSGGTEVTKLAPQAAKAIEGLDFTIEIDRSNASNPRYRLVYEGKKEILLYSKLFSEISDTLPSFASLMCCSQAEETCPFVPGTELRVALNYEDPKHADGSPNEDEAYQKCLMLIGSEINYVFSEAQKHQQN
ncbi:MAG: protein-tyrosine-phosphatase [Flavobacteriales bacterium]|nr:protein-tyrosine-phosphatase [Flavobacteriales bacterium]|tara:strand:- start:1179 stop:1802 length:624 start_codon:yes stop_codon:yes gene_type:complete